MTLDEDIKIAEFGEKGPKVSRNDGSAEYERQRTNGNLEKAQLLGKKLSENLIENINKFSFEDEHGNSEMMLQRGVLLAFSAIAGVEEGIENSLCLEACKSGFNSVLEKEKKDLYKYIVESGAFSFYYLAHRRGNEVDRRIGQTFAMLCGHDGDSIYQELGEAIYCWFVSFTKKMIQDTGFIK